VNSGRPHLSSARKRQMNRLEQESGAVGRLGIL